MLKSPCKNCPFRRSGDEPVRLTSGRVREVWLTTMWNGQSFPCHKTVEHTDDGEEERVNTSKAQHCMGSTLSGIKSGRGPNQMSRVLLRLSRMTSAEIDGMLDLVFGSESEMLATAIDRERKRKGAAR